MTLREIRAKRNAKFKRDKKDKKVHSPLFRFTNDFSLAGFPITPLRIITPLDAIHITDNITTPLTVATILSTMLTPNKMFIVGRVAYMDSFDIPNNLYVRLSDNERDVPITKPISSNYFSKFSDILYDNFFREMRLRWIGKRLLTRFRIRRMDRVAQDNIDPILFNPIVTPIVVYDMKYLRKYVFEAKSLVKAMNQCLFQQLYSIPCPKMPINIITNRPFTYGQLLSITRQLIDSKVDICHIGYFKDLGFSIDRWKTYMSRHLQLSAIREELFNYESSDGESILENFILDQLADLNIPPSTLFEGVLHDSIVWFPDHPLLQSCRRLCMRHYEASIFNKPAIQYILLSFKCLFMPYYRKCDLWDKTVYRQQKDSLLL